ncbi:MAG: glycosyltransferase [Candidatus Omnitrophica bacterium]|nr:glycosyltransferase [Candidatus Omnitrophota bacterium]
MDDRKITVSVIIPTYNNAGYIASAVTSVLVQTCQEYEIIVVDDGSTDETMKVLEPYIKSRAVRYTCQENQGVSCARNKGIKMSNGELVAFLDADDMWMANKLELELEAFRAHPDAGIIHADIRKVFSDNSISRPCRYGLSGDEVGKHSGDVFNDFLSREIYISCSTVMVRKECFDNVGLFDENLSRLGFEDFDMWLRILRYYQAYYIDEAIALYRVRENSMTRDRAKMQRGHEYVIAKITDKFGVSEELRRKASKAMMKEWGMGRYGLINPMHESLRRCRSKLLFVTKPGFGAWHSGRVG